MGPHLSGCHRTSAARSFFFCSLGSLPASAPDTVDKEVGQGTSTKPNCRPCANKTSNCRQAASYSAKLWNLRVLVPAALEGGAGFGAAGGGGGRGGGGCCGGVSALELSREAPLLPLLPPLANQPVSPRFDDGGGVACWRLPKASPLCQLLLLAAPCDAGGVLACLLLLRMSSASRCAASTLCRHAASSATSAALAAAASLCCLALSMSSNC
mmetsp:Transcript_43952/g.104006  ORF Transcript_43952/g.104006 Transcript_43952/m.104006 type:complete len:212 (-) Transcript_43952:692-1327(-)